MIREQSEELRSGNVEIEEILFRQIMKENSLYHDCFVNRYRGQYEKLPRELVLNIMGVLSNSYMVLREQGRLDREKEKVKSN